MNVRRLSLAAPVLLGLFAGCTVQSGSSTSSDNAVTSIPQTGVTDQGQTGNCWLYATAGWIESLQAAKTGDASTHYSPAYWMYWDLFAQVIDDGKTTVAFGGYWARAVDLAARYGMMKMGDFVGDDAKAGVDALNAVNVELTKGQLATPGGRQNRELVLRVLNKAFGLSTAVQTTLAGTFGADGSQTFDTGAQASDATITAPHDVAVLTVRAGDGSVSTTLDLVLGTRGSLVYAGTPRYFTRVGSLAWNATSPSWGQSSGIAPGQFGKRPRLGAPLSDPADGGAPDDAAPPPDTDTDATTDTDAGADIDADTDAGADASPGADATQALVRRIQRALNDGAPLPIGWYVNFQAVDRQGHFRHSDRPTTQSQTGGHETLITDYEVTGVPGYGTLPVGVVATDDQKQAALQGTVTFLRTKNSWGKAPAGWAEPLAGYNDLDIDYLSKPITVCPDPVPSNDEAGAPAPPGPCSTFSPLILDVAIPPGY